MKLSFTSTLNKCVQKIRASVGHMQGEKLKEGKQARYTARRAATKAHSQLVSQPANQTDRQIGRGTDEWADDGICDCQAADRQRHRYRLRSFRPLHVNLMKDRSLQIYLYLDKIEVMPF